MLMGIAIEIPFALGEAVLGVEAYLTREWQILQIVAYLPIAGTESRKPVIWPRTDTECHIWAKSAKLSFLTVHPFYFKSIKKRDATFWLK